MAERGQGSPGRQRRPSRRAGRPPHRLAEAQAAEVKAAAARHGRSRGREPAGRPPAGRGRPAAVDGARIAQLASRPGCSSGGLAWRPRLPQSRVVPSPLGAGQEPSADAILLAARWEGVGAQARGEGPRPRDEEPGAYCPALQLDGWPGGGCCFIPAPATQAPPVSAAARAWCAGSGARAPATLAASRRRKGERCADSGAGSGRTRRRHFIELAASAP